MGNEIHLTGIKAILFDLGGVLVDWDGVTPLIELTQGRFSPEQARLFWLQSPWVRRFETGRCTETEFAVGALQELGVKMEPDAFVKEFSGWDRGPFPGAIDLLKHLSSQFPLYCLSNNNRIHWHNPGIQELVSQFRQTFVSFEIGLMKPDPAAFAYVLERVPEPAESILFLDDNSECVDAALNSGMNAQCVTGLSEVKDCTEKMDLFSR